MLLGVITYAHSFSRDESPIQTLIPTLNFKACVSRVRVPVFVCVCVSECVCLFGLVCYTHKRRTTYEYREESVRDDL